MPDSPSIPHFYGFDYADFLTVTFTNQKVQEKGELVVVIKLYVWFIECSKGTNKSVSHFLSNKNVRCITYIFSKTLISFPSPYVE